MIATYFSVLLRHGDEDLTDTTLRFLLEIRSEQFPRRFFAQLLNDVMSNSYKLKSVPWERLRPYFQDGILPLFDGIEADFSPSIIQPQVELVFQLVKVNIVLIYRACVCQTWMESLRRAT